MTPPPGSVWLWWLAAEQAGPAAMACLTPAERHRAARLHPPAGQRFAAARAALRRILGALTGMPPRTLDLRTDARGRVYLPGGPVFSLSHSAGRVLCAVAARGRVGVDVEAHRPVRGVAGLGAELFGADFGARARAAPPAARNTLFLAAWTRAEAVLKAAGTGWAGAGGTVEVGLGGPARVQRAGHALRIRPLALPQPWHAALATDFAVQALRWCGPPLPCRRRRPGP